MDYTFTTQLLSPIPTSPPTPFDLALSSPLFPASLISASLASFNNPHPSNQAPPGRSGNANPGGTDLEAQNKLLFNQLETALENQRTAIKQVLQLERERHERAKQDERKASRKRKRRLWRMGIEQQRREAVMKNGMADEDGIIASLRGGVIPVPHATVQEVETTQTQDERTSKSDPEEPSEDLSSTTDDFTD